MKNKEHKGALARVALARAQKDKAAVGAVDQVRAAALAIVEACNESNAVDLAAGFVRDGASLDRVRADLGRLDGIRAAVEAARKANAAIDPGKARELFAAGLTVEEASARLADLPATASAPSPVPAADAGDAHGWDRAIAAVSGEGRLDTVGHGWDDVLKTMKDET